MSTTRSIALFWLFISLSAYVNSSSFIMHITCAPCTISCGFSNCYKTTASDGSYSEEICGDVNCLASFSQNITV